MDPLFKPSVGAPDVIAPQYVKLAMDNDDLAQLAKVIVTYNDDGQPLNYLTDDEWDFTAYIQTKLAKNHSSAVWRWKNVPDAFQLTLKRLLYTHLFETRRTSIEGMSGLTKTFRDWSVLARLCQQCELPSLSALGQVQTQRKILAALKESRYALYSVTSYLNAIALAHRYKFINFPIANSAQLAKKLCDPSKSKQQTLAIPQSLAAQIYSHAINRIEMWYGKRVALASLFDEYLDLKEKQVSHDDFEVLTRRIDLLRSEFQVEHKKASCEVLVTMLYNDILVTCGALIGAISGMRYCEWYELDSSSYQEETYKGVTHCLLVGKTSKLNHGIPRHHAWVTAPVARLVIELLTAVSDPRRTRLLIQANDLELSGQPLAAAKLAESSKSLFLALGVHSNHGKAVMVASSSINSALKRFVASVPNEDGTLGAYLRKEHLAEFKALNRQWSSDIPLDKLWPIATHQFRRTFAVFLLRNGFGSFLQVKEQFAHHNLSMSIWYGRNSEVATAFDMEQDTELQAELAEMNTLLMTDIAEKIYLSDELISGGAGLSIRAQIAQGNIVFESREEIEAAVRNGDLTIVDNGHSLCLNPSCGRLDCTIDPVINPVLCSHDVIMEQHAQRRVELRSRLIRRHKYAVEQNLNQPNLLAKTLVGIRACEKIMTDHGIEFEPYGALIDIKILEGV
ncbi:hypothetical protein PYU99_06700 [Aeromonas media]|uniref:hypothetical protein n=1 Tax=Aeromonas TaxID=642 RepID=UPI0022E753A9|nr:MULTISPECIES: hypothetical protein [Aeromonas]WED82624.1 hypothetical protein PYU99_06700 [Aeromonas media]